MRTILIAILAFLPALIGAPLSADDQPGKIPLEALKRGGYMILFRHGETDSSLLPREKRVPEPTPLDLANCELQSKLTKNGREDARVIGEGFKALRIPVGIVLASGYCRTMETARLAFGRAEAADMLLHPAYAPIPGAPIPPAYTQRRETLRQFLATPPPSGTNTVLVSHGEIFKDIVGSDGATGEGSIYKSDGKGGYTLVGRVLPKTWLPQ
jgi:broad specificity phosphatase PhoE